jgi:N utilization substance protein B
MTTRRRAREIVLQLLYEEDMNPVRDESTANDFLQRRLLRNKPLIAFAKSLWNGVIEQQKVVDAVISAHAANWSIKRMASIDRNVLRLATYEMTFADVPGRVAINEAVNLAKRYGDRNSGQFVNGVLDRILKNRESSESAESALETPQPETAIEPSDVTDSSIASGPESIEVASSEVPSTRS